MARPRKGHEKHAGNRVMFRITDEARDGLQRLSSKNGTLIADEARAAIHEYLLRHGEVRGPVPSNPVSVPPQVPAQAEPKKASVFGAIARKG